MIIASIVISNHSSAESVCVISSLSSLVSVTFGPGAPGPRANVVGYQLLVAAAIGFYCFYTSLKAVTKAVFVISQ